MKKTTRNSLIALGVLASTVFGAQSAFAFGGEWNKGENNGLRHGGFKAGLVSEEQRTEWKVEKKAEFENLTEEERKALHEEKMTQRKEMHEAKKAEFESFTGLTRDEMKVARQSDESMGDILGAKGVTEDDVETFFTTRLTEKVDSIVERHDLGADAEQTMRDRISEFVGKILGKWFGATN